MTVLGLDLGPRAVVFAFKLAGSAVLALALAYLLELDQPQWAVVTACLASQPLAGAGVAKGLYRLAGSAVGGIFGLLAIGLFAQAGGPFIVFSALWLGACTYAAAITRNFASYGFSLAGFTGVLIAFEGVAAPPGAWMLAVDRVSEVGLGIVCSSAVGMLVFPVHAGDALRSSVATALAGLAGYAAAASKPGFSDQDFVRMRGRMLGEVVRFDALRSFAVFDTPGLHADDGGLRRIGRELLRLLSVARNLYQRIDELRRSEIAPIHARLDPALADASAVLQRIADDPQAIREPRRIRAELVAVRGRLADAARGLEAEAGGVPAEALANAVLVLRRVSDMVHSLSMAHLACAVTVGEACGPRRRPSSTVTRMPPDHAAAAAQGLRAAVALMLVSVFWIFSAWTAGTAAAWSVAIMMCFFVTADDPASVGLDYFAGVVVAIVLAFPIMVFVLPRLEDFASLAALLMLILVPTGLAAATPRRAWFGLACGVFMVIEIGLSNVPTYDVAGYVDTATGLILGMGAGILAIRLILPPDPVRIRRRTWSAVIAALPPAARGERSERQALSEIVVAVGNLLPHLDFTSDRDEQVLRGSLGTASTGLELVRLEHRAGDPALPAPARRAVCACLASLAAAFERLHAAPDGGAATLADGAAAIAEARAILAAHATDAGDAASAVIHALASLRFLADRLDIDRPFLTQEFAR
jgi:uncharacterized membrane protein YccC